LLTACSALALAACGGDANRVEQRVNPGPTIERGTAEQLAVRSDEVARLLEGGANCDAMAEGARLRDELDAAVTRGVIPEVYLQRLSGAVDEILAQIPPCEDVAQVPPPPRDRERGRGEDQEKDKGRKDDKGRKGNKSRKGNKGRKGDEGDD
jgi:hypothetical protein